MSVLILGGNRFMGRHVTALLAAAGQVPVLFNRGNLPSPPDVETIIGGAGYADMAQRLKEIAVRLRDELHELRQLMGQKP